MSLKNELCGLLVCPEPCSLAKIFKNMRKDGCTPDEFMATKADYFDDCKKQDEAEKALEESA